MSESPVQPVRIKDAPAETRGKNVFLSFSLSVIAVTSILFGSGWALKSRFEGRKPTLTYEQYSEENALEETADAIQAARAEITRDPDSLSSWKRLKDEISKKIRLLSKPDKILFGELQEALKKLAELQPEDPGAHFELADFYFSLGMFPEASVQYQTILTLVPDDERARTNYASTLTFLKKFDQAIVELKTVQSKNPKSFHAAAYLAITYSEMGDSAETLKAGNAALELAPTREAYERFNSFFEKYKRENDLGETASTPPVKAVDMNAALEAFFRNHPITASKFQEIKLRSGDNLLLLFRDFPMDQMPPFAKEKFFTRIREAMAPFKDTGIKTLIFADAQSGEELERLSLTF